MCIRDRRYINKNSFVSKNVAGNPFPESAADAMIKQDTAVFRVLNVGVSTFNDASTSYHHQSVGGYHGAKLKRYKELIDSCFTPQIDNIRQSFSAGDSIVRATVTSQSAVNMMNAKYIIYNPEAPPLPNPGALGNAWFVSSVRIVPDANAEIGAINSLDPSREVVVDKRFEDQVKNFKPAPDSTASIRLTQYQPNHLTYQVKSSSSQLTVFSEVYYDKGWNAYVDGKEAPYFRCNYVLRGMVLPAGNHTVEFKFEPTVYSVGEKISLAGSIILLALLGYLLYSGARKTTMQASAS